MMNRSLVPRPSEMGLPRLLDREMDRMFDEFFDSFTRRVPALFGRVEPQWGAAPRIDITDTGREFVLQAEVPGYKREELHVDVSQDSVTLRGERKEEQKQESGSYVCRERWQGSFERSFRLPDEIRSDQVSAKLKDGVLTLTLPKAHEEQRREIEVTEA